MPNQSQNEKPNLNGQSNPQENQDGPTWEELTAGALADLVLPEDASPVSSRRESTLSKQPIPPWFTKVYENT